MDFGVWTENSRGAYNKWDGVARCSTQVTSPSNLVVIEGRNRKSSKQNVIIFL